MKQIAYLGWLGAGNLGDEACFQLFQKRVQSIVERSGCGPITCVPITIIESQRRLFAFRPGAPFRPRSEWRPGDYDYVVLGGGSLLNADRYIKALRLAQVAGVPTAVWGTGFDGLPNALAAKLKRGLDLRSERHAAPLPHPVLSDVLRACRFAGVRGPVTAAWLEANGCGSPGVSGDPGLLFDAAQHAASTSPQAASSNGSIAAPVPPPKDRIAVIWGMSQRATHQGPGHAALTQTVAQWLGTISNRWKPVICAMWSHDLPAARQLALYLGAGTEMLEEPLTLGSFAELMRRSAFTLSYRLHGCILSAASGTPFCSIAYRSKCYDFARSIDVPDWVVDPGNGDVIKGLDRWFSHVSGKKARTLREQLDRSAARYRKSLADMVRSIVSDLARH